MRAQAVQSTQIPLNPKNIPQFVDELPDLLAGDSLLVDSGTQIDLTMTERLSMVLSTGTVPNYQGTVTWAYIGSGQANRASYLGPVVLATKNSPTQIKFINNLGSAASTQVLAYKYSTDQTLHWADPMHDGMNMWNHMARPPVKGEEGAENYLDAIPAVPHLHGGYIPPVLDGGPDAWFTSDGVKVGSGYYSRDGLSPKNYCIYNYLNDQEGALIWFHDHTLGATRLNVYCGLAGAYLILDPGDTVLPTFFVEGQPLGYTITPLVIQDRMFDTNGQLFFPADCAGGLLWALNPEHPYWVPEFIGDTICVNGKTWPRKTVEQRRYLLMFINGSNARSYELSLVDPVSKNFGPPLWVVATDGGYLNKPVRIDPAAAVNNKLLMMPGERYWVIVDFAGYAGTVVGPNGVPYSGKWLLKNTAKAPYPGGASPQGATTGKIMQFVVTGGAVVDTSYNPDPTAFIRPVINDLTLAPLAKTRQLTLNEIMGMPQNAIDPVTGVLTAYPGGPLEILVNNTKWDGYRITGVDNTDPMMPIYTKSPIPGFIDDGHGNYLSEIPTEGDTELWEIVNTTADAHPIHTHLAQFQLQSRQAYDTKKYFAAYSTAFPAGFDFTMKMNVGPGVFIPAYGPPLAYDTPIGGKYGGNPDVTPFLKGPVKAALPQEAGWKDTVMAPPGMVTRFLIRWAPQGIDPTTPSTNCHLSFDPSAGGGGYVWHCHIVDHEDNEMMRPDMITPNQDEPSRQYRIGLDY
ncbi:MAG: copper oxidase [Anaerolineae bacterium]|nr:copper oxidase [Anaerolineae bacterium]